MTFEKREQVFVSSTYLDLQEERRSVIQTLLEANCIPAGMEMFPASNAQKFDLIKKVIDGCDYYVVIVGGRYGSVDETQLSYTEKEYDYAVSQSIPVMAFLHGNPGQLPVDKSDVDPTLREKLDEFRAKAEERMVKYWENPRDLSGQVALSLIQLRRDYPAVGWVRGDQALTPEIEQELGELRLQVKELTAELSEEKRNHSGVLDTDELAQGDEPIRLKCRLSFHWQEDIDNDNASYQTRDEATWEAPVTWNEILKTLGPELLEEATEDEMGSRLSGMCFTVARRVLVEDQDEEDDIAKVGTVYWVRITPKAFDIVKVQLVGLGLIEAGEKRRTPTDKNIYWKLTEKGRQELLTVGTIRRNSVEAEA